MSQADEVHHYLYFTVGVVPVRVLHNKDNLIMGAEIPDEETPDGFIYAHEYLGFIDKGEEVEEINAEEFNVIVKDYRQTYKKNRTQNGIK